MILTCGRRLLHLAQITQVQLLLVFELADHSVALLLIILVGSLCLVHGRLAEALPHGLLRQRIKLLRLTFEAHLLQHGPLAQIPYVLDVTFTLVVGALVRRTDREAAFGMLLSDIDVGYIGGQVR